MTPGDSTPDSVSAPPLESPKPIFAWQPLTPRGVAAFAQATFGRLLVIQLIVAVLAAAAVVWFLSAACFPTVRQAIRQLPEQGTIRNGKLSSPRLSAAPLAEGRVLAFVVDMGNQSKASLSADIRVEFRGNDFEICSLLGCFVLKYPKAYVVEFNRVELEPWWGAWEPMLLALVAIAVIASLLLTWIVLALVYFGFVRLIAFFKDRQAKWGGAWRLAGAALMPGALLLTAGILLYGLGILDLIRFLLLLVLHLLLGWIYLFFGTLKLPPISSMPRPTRNPFAPSEET